MAGSLSGTNVAILVTNGFEQSELTEPKKALEQAGAQALIISPAGNQVRGWNHKEWGDSFPVDVALNDAQSGDYSALLLPGGVMNPDYLRWNAGAVAFVKSFVDANKPHRSDLSWALDIDRGGCGAKSQDHLVAIIAHGSYERGSPLGRSRSRGRRSSGHQPQTG